MSVIGVDARSLLCREPRGEGKTLLRLYEEISKQRPDIEIWFFGDSSATEYTGVLPAGIHVDVLPTWGHRIDGWENFCLPAMAWRRRCSVLHCASSSAPRWSPCPVVMTVHDMIPALHFDGHDAEQQKIFLTRLGRGLRHARHVIAVSENTKRDLCNHRPDLAQKISVIHWACDPTLAPPASGPRAAKYIVTFGGAARRKNTVYTLRRFARIAEQVPGVTLVILGIGQQATKTALLQHAVDLGIESRVEIPGFIPEDRLNEWLSGASLMLYLSLYEGFGLPVLEAITRGVPVIVSDRSSLPELLLDAPGCVSLEDPVAVEATAVGLLTGREDLVHWCQKQRAAIRGFTWRSTAEKALALLLDDGSALKQPEIS